MRETDSSLVPFYGNGDPREVPLYSISEGARYIHVPTATLRSWVRGRTYPRKDEIASFEPLIRVDQEAARLSFYSLIEAHILRALRTKHRVSVRAVRSALSYAEQELGIQRLLLSDGLRAAPGELFLERYGELINLSKSGQLAIRTLLQAYLKRVERDTHDLPLRLYPFLVGGLANGPKTIVIDPRVSFGRPTVAGTGISTAALASRIDAGESIEELASDYHLNPEQIREAVVYEKAA